MATPDGSIVNAFGEDHEEIDAPTLPVGFVIADKYQIKRVLSVGGNGAVYEGEHTEIGHRVAIKVAHRKLDDRGDVMARFRREARICGSLRHPHIGQVFDVGTLADGAPYMVMELQEGRSLADVVDETSLPVAAIIDITRQLLAGLNNVMLVRDHGGHARPDPGADHTAPGLPRRAGARRAQGAVARSSSSLPERRAVAPKRNTSARTTTAAAAPAPAPAPVEKQQDPALTRAQLKEASTAFVRGRTAEALAIYQKLVVVAPREAEAWRGLAVTANQLAERSQAERALRRYMQLRPNARDGNRILQRLGDMP